MKKYVKNYGEMTKNVKIIKIMGAADRNHLE